MAGANLRAEVASGVGKDTDLAIILTDGVHHIETGILDSLETVFNDYQRIPPLPLSASSPIWVTACHSVQG